MALCYICKILFDFRSFFLQNTLTLNCLMIHTCGCWPMSVLNFFEFVHTSLNFSPIIETFLSMPSIIETRKWCLSVMICSHAAISSLSDVAHAARYRASEMGVFFFKCWDRSTLFLGWDRIGLNICFDWVERGGVEATVDLVNEFNVASKASLSVIYLEMHGCFVVFRFRAVFTVRFLGEIPLLVLLCWSLERFPLIV